MPGVSAVGGLEQSAAGSVDFVAVLPRALARFPHGGIDHVGIRGIDLDVGGAGVLVFVDDLLPGLAAIGGAEKAALFIRAVGMAEHGGEDSIGIARIDGERGNLQAIAQAEMSPGFSGVSRFVDSVADREIGAMQAFAAGDINNVGIRRRYCDGADRLRGLVVEDGCPGAAVVVRLPNSAVDLAHVENIRLAGNASGGAGAASAKRADHAPMQILISILRNLLCGARCDRTGKPKRRRTDERLRCDLVTGPPQTLNAKLDRIN